MSTSRWKGLVALTAATVEHGSSAVETIQLEMAGRTFGILEKVPPIAVPTRIVRAVHDASVKVTHGSIRLVASMVKGGLDVAIDVVEARAVAGRTGSASVEPTSPPTPLRHSSE